MVGKMSKIAFLLWLILVSIIILSIAGCESQPGYRTLTVKNKLVSFSFEYSTYYKKEGPFVNMGHIPPYTDVGLYAPLKDMKITVPDFNEGGNLKTVSASYCPASIDIFISVQLPGAKKAEDRIESWISTVEEEGHSESLVRSPVVVSGINAEMLDFTRDSGMILAVDKKIEYNRVIYFDYGGYLWSFTATSEKELLEQVTTDFYHVVETFQIIYANQL
jgi:hypothetical protein